MTNPMGSVLIEAAMVRKGLRIVRDVTDLPDGSAGQRSCFVQQTTDLLHAKAGVLMRAHLPTEDSEWYVEVLCAEGWLTETEQNLFRVDVRERQYRSNPLLQKVIELLRDQTDFARAWRRHQLVDDDAWYNSNYVQNVFRTLAIDDLTIGFVPMGPLTWGCLAIVREWGDSIRFSEQDEAMLAQLTEHLYPRVADMPGVTPVSHEIARLPPRLRDVYGLLLEGLAEKEIAARLELSPCTVHRHVTRLYQALRINSRHELMARELKRIGRPEAPQPTPDEAVMSR